MQFNEFSRRLEKAHLSHDAMFLLSHMFEVQVEFSKALDVTLGMMERLVGQVHDVNNINGSLIQQLRELRRGTPGVDVHSVRIDPDEKD